MKANKKITRILIMLAVLAFCVPADAENGLKFNKKGEFKIVQFTDLHYNIGKKRSAVVPALQKEVLKAENPELVVITGDLVYASPVDENIKAAIAEIAKSGIPFCFVFGNHDRDFGPAQDMLNAVRSFPNCVIPTGVGSPDYSLTVKSSNGENVAAVLYCIDSNAHLFDTDGKFIGYDNIHPEQIDNYRRTSAAYTASHNGEALPALMFLHIPLNEYAQAASTVDNAFYGTRMEGVCCPVNNSGMFQAIKECGDVFAVFAGHDHDNDYITLWDGVLLAYGRYSGCNTEYNHIRNGARVIVLKEGERSIRSWIRLRGGVVTEKLWFPDYFIPGQWVNGLNYTPKH